MCNTAYANNLAAIVVNGRTRRDCVASRAILINQKEVYIMVKEKDIRQRLYELGRHGRESYLRLMGIDVPSVRELEKEINAGYEDLAAAIQDMLKDAGKQEADMHEKSLERVRSMIRKDTDTLAARLAVPVEELAKIDYTETLATRLAVPVEELAKLLVWCWCFYLSPATYVPPPQDFVDLDPPTGGGASGSVTYNAATTIAHPKAEAKGMGTGTINSAKVNVSFRFSFMPTTDRVYCIRPIVQMNGHWLVWTWGSCAGTAQDLGSGTARVTLRVRVDQVSLTVAQIEHKVFEQSASAGLDIQSGFGYNSVVDGGACLEAYLQGGHEAVIWVECESYAEIANHGRAWVDMQTSPFFHFSVPEVWWGVRFCWPWIWGIPAIASLYKISP